MIAFLCRQGMCVEVRGTQKTSPLVGEVAATRRVRGILSALPLLGCRVYETEAFFTAGNKEITPHPPFHGDLSHKGRGSLAASFINELSNFYSMTKARLRKERK